MRPDDLPPKNTEVVMDILRCPRCEICTSREWCTGMHAIKILCKTCPHCTSERKEIVMKPDDLPPKYTSEKTIEETYTMLFTCTNCGTEFLHEVEKGRSTHGQGGTCPYCNIEDYSYKYNWLLFECHKPTGSEERMGDSEC